MSEPKKEKDGPTTSPSRTLATQIYISLVSANVEITEGAVKMKASAENLAKLSLKLADAFYSADDATEAAKAPKTGFKLDASDIASWQTK